MSTRFLAILTGLLVASLQLRAADSPALAPQLEPLRPFLEKTWKGTFKGSTPEKPIVDIARWERILNGEAVRGLHSINDGIYGGEVVFRWDKEKGAITFYYFTTAGFMTTGTLTAEGKKLTTHEKVSGDADGITEVRATTEILPDGSFHVKSEHLKNGEWVPGHEVTYSEAPDAKVAFK